MSRPSAPQRRILVVGCGSIGRRHITNLLACGQQAIRLVDPDERALAQACGTFKLEGVANLDEGLRWEPDAVVIATPTSTHIETALAAAEQGSHLLIEKPLGDRLDGIEKLIELVHAKRLVSLVACNMRFHPGPRLVHDALAKGMVGAPLGARFEVGSYLPSWRPGTDYHLSYSARPEMGGGCVLDMIHELDLACWMFGFPSEVVAMTQPGKSLGVAAEALAEILLRYPDDRIVSVHADYVQRWRARRCEVIGDQGTLVWDSRRGEVLAWGPDAQAPTRLGTHAPEDANPMYVDELRHFLECLDGRETSCADVEWAARVLRVALAAKASARQREAVALRWEEPAAR